MIKTFGALKVGFIGLCLNTSEISGVKLAHTRIGDPLAAAARYLPLLKRGGATVIVAVTHLAFETDRALVQRFPQIDLIIGGHEHYPITATENRTLVSKAGSDARYVARIDVNRRAGGTVERFFELLPITAAIADEPNTAAVVASYETRLGGELDTVVGTTRVPLDAVSVRMRASETNIGDLVADAMRADAGADIAIMNAGSIRGDRIYAAGPLTRRALLEMLPFGNVICKIALPGRVVLQALNSGVAELPASAGRFPQVSGLTMRVEVSAPAGNRVRDVKVNGQPLDGPHLHSGHPRLPAQRRRWLHDVRRRQGSHRPRNRQPDGVVAGEASWRRKATVDASEARRPDHDRFAEPRPHARREIWRRGLQIALQPQQIVDRVDVVRAADETRFDAAAFRGAQRVGQHALGPPFNAVEESGVHRPHADQVVPAIVGRTEHDAPCGRERFARVASVVRAAAGCRSRRAARRRSRALQQMPPAPLASCGRGPAAGLRHTSLSAGGDSADLRFRLRRA